MDETELLYGCRKETAEIVQKLRLIDDIFMTKVFEDKDCSQLLLRVILGRDDLTISEVVPQLEVKNMQGRSAKFDIYAVDTEGKHYNIEVQRDNEGADARRARFNASLLDANFLRPRQDVKDLPEVYIIFITEHDVLGGNKPIYTIRKTIAELDNAIFDDGVHIIYVNGEIRDKTELGKLMQDFFCRDPHKMNNKILSERTVHFKQSKEGFKSMCKIVDDYAARQAAEQAQKARIEEKRSFAIELWNDGIRDIERIAKLTKLPLDEVKEMFKGESA